MRLFWHQGYAQTSMDALVRELGSSRARLYQAFGGKKPLFLACLASYQDSVVSPAFAAVERPTATLDDIADYFDTQISLAEAHGLPGPGCLVANTMTELAPHDADADAAVRAHNRRLQRGFAQVLRREAAALDPEARTALAEWLTASAQGLWSYSRCVDDAAPLRRYAATLMDLLRQRLAP